MGDKPGDEAGAASVLAVARADRARLEFLLRLGHELRTPAGVIVGYLSLARQGEIRSEDALDVVDTKAQELCSLLDAILVTAEQELASRERWRSRAEVAAAQSRRLRQGSEATMLRARKLAAELQRQLPVPGEDVMPRLERRDAAARKVRDQLAARTGLHPRALGLLSCETAAALLAHLDSTGARNEQD